MDALSVRMGDERLPERLDVCLQCPESLGGETRMTCMALDGQGRLMVTGCGDGKNIVWDLETRGVRVVLEDARWKGCGPVEHVLLSEDGMFVLSCHSLRADGDGCRKMFVLWMLGRSSEVSVVATHELMCSNETGRVFMCAGPRMMHHGVVMAVIMTLDGTPMVLNVYGESSEMTELNKTIKGMYPAVGIGSKSDDKHASYRMESKPLDFPRGGIISGKKVEEQSNSNNQKKKQESVSSGGTTITDTKMDDAGGDLTSRRDDESIIGRKVVVYWDGDGEWFRGTVKSRDDTRMFVAYDDGDEEWVLFHGDIPWKYVDSEPKERSKNVLLAYCASKDIVAVCDQGSMQLTLYNGCDFSVTHVLDLAKVDIAPSSMTFSRDGSLLALTYSDGFIELVHIEDHMKVVRKLDFLECSGGLKKMRQHEWVCSAFSPGGTYLFSSMTLDKTESKHCILTWDHKKNVAKNLLQGQGSKILAMLCHPVPTPMQILALSEDGRVYIWSSIMHQNWTVFQPEFETLDRNREYVEVETEFDLPPLHDALPPGDSKPKVLHDEASDEEILID